MGWSTAVERAFAGLIFEVAARRPKGMVQGLLGHSL